MNGNVTAAGSGSCVVDVNVASDSNYLASSTSTSVTFTPVVTVRETEIVQTSASSGSVETTASGTYTAGPIAVQGNSGLVTFVTTAASLSLLVSSSGLISTTGTLAAGSYKVSGTDSDPRGDSGTWTYTLTVTAVAVTVTFDANGGTGSMSPEEANSPTALSLNQFVRKGYTFVDWNTAANGSGFSYGNGATFPFTAGASLFAHWKHGKVPARTITFVANGGKGTTASEVENTPTAVKASDYTRRGYTFVGWNTKANAKGVRYEPGNTYSFKKSITMYAQWKKAVKKSPPKPTSFAVIFRANGGVGKMVAETHHNPTSLTSNHFTRSGYSFVGWNTAANGEGVPYANRATYSFASSTNLYAQWKKVKAVVPPPTVPSGTHIGPFAFHTSALSPSLEAQIQSLAVEAKAEKSTAIALLGYGDALSGADASNPTLEAANIALSRERAQAVATYLEERLTALGLTGWAISVSAAPNGKSGSGQGASSIVIAALS
jgi:uncharacterized repeat protein (TIGR02543 family)